MQEMERLLEIAFMPMLNIEARGVSVNQEVEFKIFKAIEVTMHKLLHAPKSPSTLFKYFKIVLPIYFKMPQGNESTTFREIQIRWQYTAPPIYTQAFSQIP